MKTANIIWAFIKKDFRTYTSYRLQVVLGVWGVALVFVHYIFLAKIVNGGAESLLSKYGGNYFPFAILGVAFAHFFDMSLNGLSRQIRQGQTLGTLEVLFVSPVPALTVVVGMVAFQFLYSLLYALVYIAAGVIVAGVNVSFTAVVGTLLFLVLTVFAFVGLGLMAAAFIMVFKRGEPIALIFQGVSYLLSGVYYPVSVLPKPMQHIAQFLPLTHSMEAVRKLWLSNAGFGSTIPEAIKLLLFGVIFIPIGLWAFAKSLRIAKRDGSIGQF